jgi:hypothetical protein
VRGHWSVAASDRFDAVLVALSHYDDLALRVLAAELADAGTDSAAAAACLERFHRPVWEGEVESWRSWIWEHWPPDEARELRRELEAAERTLTWRPDAREEMRSRDRAQLEELEGLLRFDLSEEEMAPLLADRITGIRGRYRITGTWQETQEGITAADIDAP